MGSPQVALVLALVLAPTLAGCAGTRVSPDLDACEVGRPPRGFTSELAGGGGPPSWVVREIAGKRAVVQESQDDTSYRFPVCVLDRVVARDVEATVRFQAISGEIDMVGGIALRYSPESYYVARAHAFNDNVVLFKMVRGNRIRLREVSVPVTPREWHTLRFSAEGTKLRVWLDGKLVLEHEDATLAGPGQVALWTKADSVTAFRDLVVEATPVARADDPVGSESVEPVEPAPAPDIEADFARARAKGKPAVVVVTDSGEPEVARRVRAVLGDDRVRARLAGVEVVTLDLGGSRARAAALGLHVERAPAVLALSAGGRIVARDAQVASAGSVAALLEGAARDGPAVDAVIASFAAKVAADAGDVAARQALATTLLAHEAWREAAPHLEAVAASENVDVARRVGAWVALARARFASGEPEKGRRAAKELLARLGLTSAEARAAGNLLLGVRDGELGRRARALEELERAEGEAPGSAWAREARAERERLGAGAN